MNNIQLLKNMEFGRAPEGEKNREMTEIFNGPRRQIIQVNLRNSEILAKHTANEPITVLCLAGNGKFRAGTNLEDEQLLTAGTFLTLEAKIAHEVIAEPELSILVTKFKAE